MTDRFDWPLALFALGFLPLARWSDWLGILAWLIAGVGGYVLGAREHGKGITRGLGDKDNARD